MGRHISFTRFWILALIWAASLLIVACQPVVTAPAASSDTMDVNPALATLVVAIDSDPANLEPGTNRAFPIGSEIILNIFDTLVAWKAPDFNELEGRLG